MLLILMTAAAAAFMDDVDNDDNGDTSAVPVFIHTDGPTYIHLQIKQEKQKNRKEDEERREIFFPK